MQQQNSRNGTEVLSIVATGKLFGYRIKEKGKEMGK